MLSGALRISGQSRRNKPRTIFHWVPLCRQNQNAKPSAPLYPNAANLSRGQFSEYFIIVEPRVNSLSAANNKRLLIPCAMRNLSRNNGPFLDTTLKCWKFTLFQSLFDFRWTNNLNTNLIIIQHGVKLRPRTISIQTLLLSSMALNSDHEQSQYKPYYYPAWR